LAREPGGPDNQPVGVCSRKLGCRPYLVQDVVAVIVSEDVVQARAWFARDVEATTAEGSRLLGKRRRDERNLPAESLQGAIDEATNRTAQRGIDLDEHAIGGAEVRKTAHGVQ